jgi:hypothetical protein
MLAQDVRSYLLVCGDGESERQQLQTVCAALARLLGQLLQGNEKWSVYYWVDDILPISTTVVSGELGDRQVKVRLTSTQVDSSQAMVSDIVVVNRWDEKDCFALKGGTAINLSSVICLVCRRHICSPSPVSDTA